MDVQPRPVTDIPPFTVDGDRKAEIMASFDALEALSEAKKEELRPTIWTLFEEMKSLLFSDNAVGADILIPIGGFLSALLVAVGFTIFWLYGEHWSSMAYGTLLAVFLVFLVPGLVSDSFGGRSNGAYLAVALALAALMVLAFRTLPQFAAMMNIWLYAGLRAGLLGGLVALATLTVMYFTERLIEGFSRKWSHEPQPKIVAHLIDALHQLEMLNRFDEGQGPRSLRTMAKARAQHDSGIARGGDESDGEELITSREDWLFTRRLFIHRLNDAASYVGRGLPIYLSVGASNADSWMQSELKCRSGTIKAWARPVALCCPERFVDLPRELGVAIEHSANGNWSALSKAELPESPSKLQLLTNVFRKALIGVLPLLALVLAPYINLNISDAVRDALLTFAIPWLLLQILEFIAPDSSDHLSRAKGIREWMPKLG